MDKRGNSMRENDWTKNICELLKKQQLGENIYVETFRKIPYALEVDSFTKE